MSISDYFKKISTDVVTHHSMPRPRRPVELAEARTSESEIPALLRFHLPNGVTLEATTDREVSIGRRSRTTDPIVTLDLHQHGGFQHGVSRYHAMIVAVKGTLYLRDLNSINGTFLNGYKLLPITSYALKSGDVITLGDFEMTLEFA